MFGLDVSFILAVLLAIAIPILLTILLIRWVLGIGRRRRQLDEIVRRLDKGKEENG